MVWRKCQSPLASRQTRSASSRRSPTRRCSCWMSRDRFRCSPPPTTWSPARVARRPTCSGSCRKAGKALQPRPGWRFRQVRSRPAVRRWILCSSLVARGSKRRRETEARRVASVCTGAFLLAAAGVLDGRRATTHWMFCARLAQRFPAVRVEPDPIFVRDGPVWTSAGVTAGIDLALALVEEDVGRDLALAVARYLVVFLKRPGGQAQFSAALSLQAAEDRF